MAEKDINGEYGGDIDEMSNEQLEQFTVKFIPKKCPTCGELLSIKELGVWGYYCTDCLMWWGTYDPYPIVTKNPHKAKKPGKKK